MAARAHGRVGTLIVNAHCTVPDTCRVVVILLTFFPFSPDIEAELFRQARNSISTQL